MGYLSARFGEYEKNLLKIIMLRKGTEFLNFLDPHRELPRDIIKLLVTDDDNLYQALHSLDPNREILIKETLHSLTIDQLLFLKLIRLRRSFDLSTAHPLIETFPQNIQRLIINQFPTADPHFKLKRILKSAFYPPQSRSPAA